MNMPLLDQMQKNYLNEIQPAIFQEVLWMESEETVWPQPGSPTSPNNRILFPSRLSL
jgi:hypothetical protein